MQNLIVMRKFNGQSVYLLFLVYVIVKLIPKPFFPIQMLEMNFSSFITNDFLNILIY